MSGDLTHKIPQLAKGCRISDGPALMIPEGMLKLSKSAFQILELCDGRRPLSEILRLLKQDQVSSLHSRIENETLAFLEKLVERRALDFK